MDGAIKFNVSANTAQFDASMGRVRTMAASTATAVRGAFSGLGSLLAGGAFISGLTNILQKMDDISDRAKRFGVTAEEIQKVGNAADIVGTNFETVARAMDRTGVAANKAAREGGSIAEAFARVNLDPAAFAAASLQERIQMIAKAQRAANGDATKMAELFEVIGVRAAGINFAELATEMGNVNAASSKTVEELAKANDELTKMQQNATIFGANLLTALLVNPAQRLGSFLAGEGFSTIEEVKNKYERKAVEDRLRAEGKLLPDDSTRVPRNATDLRGSGFEVVMGPNALQNERLINEELQRAKTEKAEAERAARDAFNVANEQETEKPEPKKEPLPAARTSNRPINNDLVIDPALKAKVDEAFDRQMERVNLLEAPGATKEDLFEAARSRKRAMREYELAMMDLGRRENLVPAGQADAMMREASLTEAERARAEKERSDRDKPREGGALATETTLQKAVEFLQELTGKLPQPVLA